MFLGTLVMAIAVEHSKLHQRIALKILCLLGTGVKTLVSVILSYYIATYGIIVIYRTVAHTC